MLRFIGLLSLVSMCAAAPPADAPPDGKALFQKNCALCHKPDADNRTPTAAALKWVPNAAILTALESGSMKAQGSTLSVAERHAIADFLSPPTTASNEPVTSNACDAGARPLSNLDGWNGWSTDLVNSRMQPAGGIRAEDVPKLKVKWAFGFQGASTVFSQPTIAGGRLFFGSGNGTIYSLDAKTGCVYWTFKAPFAVRTALTLAPFGQGQYAAYFG